MSTRIQLSEANIKKTITDYLQILQNQGKLWFCRLNAGSFILTNSDGSCRRRVWGAGKGTADLLVIKKDYFEGTQTYYARCIFVELKGEHGKQSQAQKEFEGRVLALGAEYYLVKSFEELEAILE